MHFEKRRRGLLWEAFGSEGEGSSGCKRGRKKESIGPEKRGEHSRCSAKQKGTQRRQLCKLTQQSDWSGIQTSTKTNSLPL